MQHGHISTGSSTPHDLPKAPAYRPAQPVGPHQTPRPCQLDPPSASNEPHPIPGTTGPPNLSPKSKHRAKPAINYAQKRRLCELRDEYPQDGVSVLARKFQKETGRLINPSTVSRVLQKKDTWSKIGRSNEHRRRFGPSCFPIIDEIMWELIRSRAIAPSFRKDLNDQKLLKMTQEIAQILGKHGGNQKSHVNYVSGLNSFKGSLSWVSSFRKRFGIELEKGKTARSSCLEHDMDMWANETNIQERKRLLCNWTRSEDFYFLEGSVLATAVLPEQVVEETFSPSSVVSRELDAESKDFMQSLLSLQDNWSEGNRPESSDSGFPPNIGFPTLDFNAPTMNHTMLSMVGTDSAGLLQPSLMNPMGAVSGSALDMLEAEMSSDMAGQTATTAAGNTTPIRADPTSLCSIPPVQNTELEPMNSHGDWLATTSLTDAIPPQPQWMGGSTGSVLHADGLRPNNSMAAGLGNISVCPRNANAACGVDATARDPPPFGGEHQYLRAGTEIDPRNARFTQISSGGPSSSEDNLPRYTEPPAVQNQRILDDDTVVVLLLCSNGEGKQLPPWIVGKQQLKQMGEKEGEVWCDSKSRYFHNMRGWLTFRILRMWLEEFDKSLDHSVVLLSSLFTVHDLAQLKLKYVTVIPIPRSNDVQDYSMNSSSRAKMIPLYSGIEEHFRAHYRCLVVDRAIRYISHGAKIQRLSLRTAAKFVQKAWEAIPKTVVRKAWRECSYIPNSILRSAASLRVNANSLIKKQYSKLSGAVQRYKNVLELNSTGSCDKIEMVVASPTLYVWWCKEGSVLHPMGTLEDFVRSVCKTDTGRDESSDEESPSQGGEPVHKIGHFRDALRVANNIAAFVRTGALGEGQERCIHLISILQSDFKNIVEEMDDEEQQRA